MSTPLPTVGEQDTTKAGRRVRLLLFLAGTVLLSACSQLGGSAWTVTKTAVKERWNTPEPVAERVQSLPYAQVWLSGLERDALLVLGNDDDGLLSWYSADNVIVFTRNGLIVATHGLPDVNLVSSHADGIPSNLLSIVDGHTSTRYMDWMPGYRYGIPVSGRWQWKQEETVDLPVIGKRVLLRLEETLVGKETASVNVYWLDPADGFVWKSRQWVKPGLALEMTVLKPYH